MRVLVQGDTNAMGQGADGLGRGAGRRRASWELWLDAAGEHGEAGDQVEVAANVLAGTVSESLLLLIMIHFEAKPQSAQSSQREHRDHRLIRKCNS